MFQMPRTRQIYHLLTIIRHDGGGEEALDVLEAYFSGGPEKADWSSRQKALWRQLVADIPRF